MCLLFVPGRASLGAVALRVGTHSVLLLVPTCAVGNCELGLCARVPVLSVLGWGKTPPRNMKPTATSHYCSQCQPPPSCSMLCGLRCASRPTASPQVLASLPVIIYELVHKNSERHIVVWFIAGLFVLLAVPLSFHDGGCCPTAGEGVVLFVGVLCVGAHMPGRCPLSCTLFHSSGVGPCPRVGCCGSSVASSARGEDPPPPHTHTHTHVCI